MIRKYTLKGETLDNAIDIISKDKDYSGTTEYYWLSVPESFDNVLHYIRFPSGGEITLVIDNGIVEKVF